MDGRRAGRNGRSGRWAWIGALLALLPGPAAAQESGAPIRIVVGFPAGGTIDVVARLVADQMRGELKTPVIVESRPGAGGIVAAQGVKGAPPDGRTLLLSPDHTMVMAPLTADVGDFRPARDLVPVGPVARYAGGFAVAERTGAGTLAGFFDWARANPAAANVGIPAAGSIPQFLVGLLAEKAGVPLTVVPYRGSAPMVQDILGGQVAAGTTALGDFLEVQTGGGLKVVAVLGSERSPVLPNVPTLREQGYDLEWEYWLGLFAPAGTPEATVARLNAALNKALVQPEVRERMGRIVFEPAPGSPAALAARVEADTARWAPVVKASGWVAR